MLNEIKMGKVFNLARRFNFETFWRNYQTDNFYVFLQKCLFHQLQPVDTTKHQLPSPNELKRKILVKAKKIQAITENIIAPVMQVKTILIFVGDRLSRNKLEWLSLKLIFVAS